MNDENMSTNIGASKKGPRGGPGPTQAPPIRSKIGPIRSEIGEKGPKWSVL